MTERLHKYLSEEFREEAERLDRQSDSAADREKNKAAIEADAGLVTIGPYLEGAISDHFKNDAKKKRIESAQELEFQNEFQNASDIINGELTEGISKLRSKEGILNEALSGKRGPFIYERALSDVNRLVDEAGYRKKNQTGAIEFVAGLLANNLGKLDQSITPEMSDNSMSAVISLVKWGNEKERQAGLEIIEKHFKSLVTLLKEGRQPYTLLRNASTALEYMLTFGNENQKNAANGLLANLFEDYKSGNGNTLNYILALFIESSNDTINSLGSDYLKQIMEFYGLHPDKLLEVWKKNGAGPNILGNLHTMRNIEVKKPGAVKFLNKEYGINNFNRYPADLLIKQYEEHGNVDSPYGIVIYPQGDWNGSFSTDYNIFEQLGKQLEGKYLIRIFECSNKRDLAKTFIKLKNNYNPNQEEKHKIAFMLVGGHGSTSEIRLGKDGITRDDIYYGGLGTTRAGSFLQKGSTIILASCSTGANEGIGQALSEKFGVHVVAPDKPTNLGFIKAVASDGKIDFEVDYTDDNVKKNYIAGVEK